MLQRCCNVKFQRLLIRQTCRQFSCAISLSLSRDLEARHKSETASIDRL